MSKNERTYTSNRNSSHAKRTGFFIACMAGLIVTLSHSAAGFYSSHRRTIIAAASAAEIENSKSKIENSQTPPSGTGNHPEAAALTDRAAAIFESRVESRESGAELWIPACAGMTKTTQNLEPAQAGKLKTQDSKLIITAYCPCAKCCGKWANVYPRRTASGHKIRPGDKFCAADKSVPFGTMITIPGYNNGRPVPVLDRGGAITGNHIDVYFDSHKEAREWGVKNYDCRLTMDD